MGHTLMKDLLVPELKLVDLKDRLEDRDVLLCFGVGDGTLYRSRASWLKKRANRFLVFIETQEELFLKAKELPLAKDPQVRLFYYKQGDDQIFQQIAWEFVFLKFAYASCESHYQSAAHEFFLWMEHYHRGVDLLASDSEDMGLKILSNVFKNLSLLPKSSLGSSLEGKFAGMTAVICGAGPSLNGAIPWLLELKNKAVLIAGGTAVRALSAYGITPHLSAHFDPQPPYKRFLEQGSFETPLFYQGRLNHEILRKVHGPLIWMPDGGSYPLEAKLAAECGLFAEKFDSGWTVSNFCTALAAYLGCNTIIFVGMDFSCSRNETYAAQISEDENQEGFIELENKIYSKRDWLISAEWTVEFTHKNPKIHWINASTGGIHLPGIEHKELSQIVETLPLQQQDVEGIVHSLIAKAEKIQVALEKVSDVKREVFASFEKSLNLCNELLKVWEKHYPHSPLETGEYALLEHDLQQEICTLYFLVPLWNVWKHPILRNCSHPLGRRVHQLLFYKKAIETHLRS